MKGKALQTCVCLLGTAFAVTTSLASVLDELMPRPRSVVPAEGTVGRERLSAPAVESRAVAGAPAAVADEAYSLEISTSGARIVARTKLGERWARQTLVQLGKLSDGRVPCCRIVDWPALRWRGFMLDTARNFMDVKGLEELLDHMSAYKLNLFHWHLTENFAWRLESKCFPVLTEKGYYDPGDVRHRGKFYTQEDFLHVVDYAAARGIVVMPELDFPGHAHAFRKAFGYKTMRDPGVTETVTSLLAELAELVPPAKMPFVHLGGDEVWDEHEKCAPGAFTAWAEAVSRTGHKVVSWDPGEPYEPKGPRVGMIWGEAQGGADATFRADWFDARGWYIEDFDPFELLPSAAYSRPFRDDAADPRQIGAVFCAWHDASVGMPYARAWRNQQVWPACVLFGDLYWHGKSAEEFDARYCRRLPLAGDPLLSRAVDLERRVIAHRDRILADDPHPFHFLRQTDQRWRLTDAKTGRLIARDIAQATITPFFSSGNPNNYFEASNGCVIAETWIRSPREQTVGAWIGMTHMDRDHGRVRGGQGTPKRGEWNRWGGTVELNGEKIPGPDWKLPDLRPGKKVPELKYNDMIDEIPFEDEEYYMREPTPVRLREGWNHVKLTMPMPKAVVTFWSQQWSGTFVPMLGETDHPHEVPDLVYSSEPRDLRKGEER